MSDIRSPLAIIAVMVCSTVNSVADDGWRAFRAPELAEPIGSTAASSDAAPVIVRTPEESSEETPSSGLAHSDVPVLPAPEEPEAPQNGDHSSVDHGFLKAVSVRATGDDSDVLRPVRFDNSQSPFVGTPQENVTADLLVEDDSDTPADTYIDELNQLADQGVPADEGNYLADLNQLLNGQSEWVLAKGALVDLRPEEPEPIGTSRTYLNDLQDLVGPTREEGVTTAAADEQTSNQILVAYRSAPRSRHLPPIVIERGETYLIPEEQACHPDGSDSVAHLFSPVTGISVGGNSSAPPEVPRNQTQVELQRPENIACSFLEIGAPAYYFTTGYGVRRAPRNTHCFRHNPLYFEDPNLERCGRGHGCLTTAISAGDFAAAAAFSPYLMTLHHPRECVRALPDCPTCNEFGDDAYIPEWSWKAAAVQTAAVTGLVFVIP